MVLVVRTFLETGGGALPGSLDCWFRPSALRAVKSWRLVLPDTHPSVSPFLHKGTVVAGIPQPH